ncbi:MULTISPECIES: SAM-dependent methyltransferase [unclassified Bacillus (in: firmicutes)]|uniref:SAM-dependent methyltransferase n=1 Tax=unclassified Bacillus (in: firmicutes) TaxID=185979 RepID=UPI00111409E5|nr:MULTISPECIES: SAM-dependent methyltransferase [unclassified Bacillus (in: firmicutes)]
MIMFTLKPIATVKNDRKEIADDFWGEVISVIELDSDIDERSLDGIESFSHVEVFYVFDRVSDDKVEYGARHPRNNQDWPEIGIFAQRGKNRPNKLGATIVKVLKHEGRLLTVVGLDAIDGTPVVDLKPVMKEFLPREEVFQPNWSSELMADYWK